MNRVLLGVALAASLAVPAAAQHSESYTLLKAVRDGDGQTVERIVANPSSTAINARDPATGEGVLHILVRRRDLPWLSFMLRRGARPDLQDNDGMTALGMAASVGWTEGVEELLNRRASVNLANDRGETPLILAVHARQADVIPLLLEKGADPSRTDSAAGYSALDYARQDRRDPTILRLLEAAPSRGQQSSETYGPN